MPVERWHDPDDWFSLGYPKNMVTGANVYLDTSYAFHSCLSEQDVAVRLGDNVGVYDRAALVMGPEGVVEIGDYSFLNGTYVYANRRVTIGAYVMFAWGVIVTDTWIGPGTTLAERRAAIRDATRSGSDRLFVPPGEPRPVVVEDASWIGFNSVLLPGVTIGRGSIVGARTIVRESVAPYTVVVGDPPRVVRTLDPDDTPEARKRAYEEYAVRR